MFSLLWRKPLNPHDDSLLTFTVLPNDVDVSRISNDRYIAITDLGRMDLAFRNGLFRTMLRDKWAPVATLVTMRFRHPLKLFQRYRLRTRIIYWDEDGFYLLQQFERKGRVVATGYVCATLLGPHGRVAPQDVLAKVRQSAARPEASGIVLQLQELNARIQQGQREMEGSDPLGGRSPLQQ